MKQKDITEKLLEDYEDVFADIVNVLLFDGNQLISPDALATSNASSHYKATDNKLHEQERDVIKLWKDKCVNIALFGIENQTKAEKVMPLRILSYDGASYRAQLLRNPSGRLYPVVTIVLYFGWKSHWNQPKALKKVLDIPAELDAYISDYQIHVFEIAWLSDEQVSMFKSDFHIVADFFTQIRKNNDYIPSDTKI
ncbi:MAG: Rpn family recombination-promoting nuclease/putative transposase, partial [Roseburia sp.]|nr:Rpn family recombination-promoting nuclease/putative transposase [Roseburia sp.]